MSAQNNLPNQEKFREVIFKSNSHNNILRNYFNVNKGDYSLINSIYFSEGKYIISGFVFLNIISLNKINLKISKDKKNFKLIELDFDSYADNIDHNKLIDKNFEFFLYDELKIKQKLIIKDIIVIKELEFFFTKFKSYFTDIVIKIFF